MNIVYNASAGTGKTWQVTRLFEELVLQDDMDPRDILLMTFTDNAAAELRMRVAHRLLKTRRTAEANGDDERAERAISSLSQLASAPIGTIHSFCTRLLREHALEAGLSPGFTVLVGDQRDELLQQICRSELLSRLESDPDFRRFCAGAHIIGTGSGFGTSITETVPRLLDQANSLGISLEQAESLLPEPKPEGTLAAFSSILDRLHELPNPTAKARPFIEALEELLPPATHVAELVEELKRKGLKGKKFGGGKGHKPISDDFFALFNAADDAVQYEKMRPAAKAFARYVQSVCRSFQQRKHEMNVVDFDDQLRLAASLLANGTAEPKFRCIIVDEVQDTSRIQCDIIQSLWTGDAQLVICGDKKQSIYTWRGADPQVMPDLEKAILAAGGKPEYLQTSYRSKAPILDVVNRLFSEVYGTEGYSHEDDLKPNSSFATDREKSGVEFLAPDMHEEGSKQEKVAAEMEAVANRIRLLIEGKDEWQPVYRFSDNGFEPTSSSNSYRFSDILILLRRTTHQTTLEQALRHAGIPYTLGGKGRGLFARQETRDVSLFLNVITNPEDNWALIGFLRSPWIGLSDEAIAELAWSPDGFAIDRLVASYAEKTAVVDRYRGLLGTKLASELVRMLIDETGYDALLAGLPRGAQRLANLRKVIDWLRETERGAHTTPAAVARKLAEQIDNPPQIPEAALLDPAQNAVTIMTVHSAKGLTKRVVFVPDMSFSENTDRSFAQVFFDKDRPYLGLRITAPDRNSVKSPGFDTANALASEVRKHESNNLFYVAMTRARDLVVTSASIGKRTAGWHKHIQPLIGNPIKAIPYSVLADAAERNDTPSRTLPSAIQLQAALQSLPAAPAKPTFQRIPATRLAREIDKLETDTDQWEESAVQLRPIASAMGSLGHAVLEQLAGNDWQGSIADWLDLLRHDFGIGRAEAEALEDRIAQTRQLMIGLTEAAYELRPEFPFVLRDEQKLIDGTIDLLCRTEEGFTLFDYKFTDASEKDIMINYRAQMEIYYRAAQRCYPHATPGQANLIAISLKEVKCIPVLF